MVSFSIQIQECLCRHITNGCLQMWQMAARLDNTSLCVDVTVSSNETLEREVFRSVAWHFSSLFLVIFSRLDHLHSHSIKQKFVSIIFTFKVDFSNVLSSILRHFISPLKNYFRWQQKTYWIILINKNMADLYTNFTYLENFFCFGIHIICKEGLSGVRKLWNTIFFKGILPK